MPDIPINELAANFRVEFSVHQLSTGINEDIVVQSPDRWGLVVSVPIGTRSIQPPAIAPFTPYGVMMIPAGAEDKSKGILLDDGLPPLEANINTWGMAITGGYWFVPYTSDYHISVMQIWYDPNAKVRG